MESNKVDESLDGDCRTEPSVKKENSNDKKEVLDSILDQVLTIDEFEILKREFTEVEINDREKESDDSKNDEEIEINEDKPEKDEFVYDEVKRQNRSSLEAEIKPLMLQHNASDIDSDPVNADQLNNNNLLKFSTKPSGLSDNETPCLVCDYVEKDVDDSKSKHDEYLCHLIVEHTLVIADVKLIANLRSYAIYWKKRFEDNPLQEFCYAIHTNTGPRDQSSSEEYFLLCDALPEDKELREKLQLQKLKKLLVQQEFERKDDMFERVCPFCTKYIKGNRLLMFNHMTEDHNFNIGHPDNVVNVREFLDLIQQKLDVLQCLFCEKVFKDRPTLRDHMRKKLHRRLNPKNKDYDQFYIINYLELGKGWETLQSESDRLDGRGDDWEGWFEEAQHGVCFFCDSSFDQVEKVYDHMSADHEFDFPTIRQEMQMSFYQQLKMINYIRREVHLKKKKSNEISPSELASYVLKIIEMSTKWNQPQYYFSTYEDDTLLFQLEDKEGLFEPEDTFVIGEDGIDCKKIVNNSILTDLVITGYFEC